MSGKFDLEKYIPVSERIQQFWADHPEGRIQTSIELIDGDDIIIKAAVYRAAGDAAPAATGHAHEVRGQGYVNKTSHIENCESSAVGRALAMLGYEIERGIASREEMRKVERMSQPKKAKKPISERISNVIRAIGELGGSVDERQPNETEQEYFESLVEQWSRLKEQKG